MSAKHTPGPWRVGAPGPNGCHTVGTEGGLMTAMVAHSINHPEQASQAIADARLIAAAPELLEALQDAVALADANRDSAALHGITLVRPPAMQAMYDKCVAAIALAANGRPA